MPSATATRPTSPPPPAANATEGAVWRRATTALCLGMVLVGAWCRFWRLDHLPGVNGDEAWAGVQAVRLLAGEEISWRTPTGNPLNPFYFLPLVALHALWPASFALLRLPAAASGVAALAANYWLCGRTIDRRTAVVSTLLLAVLPVNIAYSRFGWDASQTLLASVLVIYPAIAAARDPSRRAALLWSAIALAAALLVHPTNVFLAPFPGVAAAMTWRSDIARLARGPWNARRAALLFVALAAAAAIARLGRHWLMVAGGRLLAPHEAAEFARHYLRLFSGATVYQFIAGSLRPAGNASGTALAAGPVSPFSFGLALHDLAAIAAVVLVAGTWWGMARRGLARSDACLLLGWTLVLLGFFLVAGPRAIAPHYERYAICLVAPGALLAARAAAWGLENSRGAAAVPAASGARSDAHNSQSRGARRLASRGAHLALACVGCALLASVYANYFHYFERTGGRSHAAFRTAATEPKEQALRLILAERGTARPVWIVASSWWSYWPIAYLATREADVRVATGEEAWERADVRQALREGRAWCVEFAGTEAQRGAVERLERDGWRVKQTDIVGFDGAAVLTVIRPR